MEEQHIIVLQQATGVPQALTDPLAENCKPKTLQKPSKFFVTSVALQTRDVARPLRTAAVTKRGQCSTHLWRKGLRYFEEGPSRPRTLPLVAFFDHPWVKRHLH